MGRFDGRVALVTGGASGMGRDTAQAFARDGARVAVLDVRKDRAEQTVGLIRDAGGEAEAFGADIRDEAQVEQAVTAILGHFGQVDVLVNNAGTIRPGTVVEVTPEEWDLVINVNLRGTYLVSRAVLPQMMERKSGAIVNIASVAGMEAGPRSAAYHASKAGVINLTRSMAIDFGPHGIRVNCICPGVIGTPVVTRMYGEEGLAGMAPQTRCAASANPSR